ncbi:MAG TPA: DUF2911 domain-containing protein [Longimicrobiaceae bacterium]|nr:DUF2911 domain-containing protein [Longimicrobiaceae bacterium]
MPPTLASRALRLAAAGLPTLLAASLDAQNRAAPETGAYVVRLGRDTVAVEEFTRTPGRLRGRQLVRSPRTQIREYVAELAPDGTVRRFDIAFLTPGEARPGMQAAVEYASDSVRVRVARGDSVHTLRLAARPGWLPLLSYSVALYEIPVSRAVRSGADSLEVTLVPIGSASLVRSVVRRAGRGEVTVTNIAGVNRVRVDDRGRLQAWDGRGTTLKITTRRIPRVSLDALAARFAALDREGRSFGQVSPRDSVRARVADATVAVNYGRPFRRGRAIFGSVVPWGQVWRTGANQATHFRTDRDLIIGSTLVPAGTYTLWTLPSPTGWQLIVNRQTGQWGTAYDASHDLARIPMQAERVLETVEQFTITVEPRDGGGVLALAWENTRAHVPFTVKPR